MQLFLGTMSIQYMMPSCVNICNCHIEKLQLHEIAIVQFNKYGRGHHLQLVNSLNNKKH